MSTDSVTYNGRTYKLYQGPLLEGQRHVVHRYESAYPDCLCSIPVPPEALYVIGNLQALEEGLGVIGARKATPYGLACAHHFAYKAAEKGITIVSGGAYGCDSQAHRAALEAGGGTVVFMGGGCDQIYPQRHYTLFQDIIDAGGAVVSENDWNYPALPHTFRARNRLIAGLSKAVLIVEAGLPSGTFSTADEALAANKDVLVVPSAITSNTSRGSNRLLYQGATPVVDDETFQDILFSLFGTMKQEAEDVVASSKETTDPLLEALRAEPMRLDDIMERVAVPKRFRKDPYTWLQLHVSELEAAGEIARFLDGRYGPAKV